MDPNSKITTFLQELSKNNLFYNNTASYTIVINEILANADDEDTGEYVEMYNYGDEPVNLSGWYVKDIKDTNDRIVDYTGEYDQGKKGTEIPPGGYCLYVDAEYNGEYSQLIKNSSDLDVLIMVTCDSDTTIGNGLTNVQDTVIVESPDGFKLTRSWTEDAGSGVSMGLIPDGKTVWVSQEKITPGFSNGRLPKVVINELMYNPKGKEAASEWLELFNADDMAMNLSAWSISDNDNNRLVLPEIVLPPAGYLVVHVGGPPGSEIDHLTINDDGLAIDYDFSDGTGCVYMNRTISMFTNTGDCVNLTTSRGLAVDYIAYGNRTVKSPASYLSWHGPNPTATEGGTIALKPDGIDDDSGSNWMEVYNENITMGWSNDHIYNLAVSPSEFGSEIAPGEKIAVNFTLKNTGTVTDEIIIGFIEPDGNWSINISHLSVMLKPLEQKVLYLEITAPKKLEANRILDLDLNFRSKTRPGIDRKLSVKLTIPSTELSAKWFEIGDNSISPITFLEGELIEAKGRVHNAGELPADTFNVSLTVELLPDNNSTQGVWVFTDYRSYTDLRAGGSKYPTFEIDSLGMAGNYSFTFFVDSNNDVIESDENDNRIITNITILPTSPGRNSYSVLITEVYYDTLISGEADEYVILADLQAGSIDISGWRLEDGEGILIFPDDTIIHSNSSIVIARDAKAYESSMGFPPDLEVEDSMQNVADMEVFDPGFGLTNSGDEVILRTGQRHIIDVVVYGSSEYRLQGWNGDAVPDVDEGLVLRRNTVGRPVDGVGRQRDTNTSRDWFSFRQNRPGQSEFPILSVNTASNITAFVTPGAGAEPILELIRSATRSIDISSYILTNPAIKNELIEALNVSVQVRILLSANIDSSFSEEPSSFASIPESEWSLLSELFARGAKIRFVGDIGLPGIVSRFSNINSKYIVIDSKISLVTTENFGLSSFPVTGNDGNRGYGLVVENVDLARTLTELFESDWDPEKADSIAFDPQDPVFNSVIPSSLPILNEYDASVDPGLNDSVYHNAIGVESNITLIIGPDTVFSFSPIMDLINNATESISIALFQSDLNWYSGSADHNGMNPFIEALTDSAEQGVNVLMLLDPHGFDAEHLLDQKNSTSGNSSKPVNLDVIKYINGYEREHEVPGILEARLAYMPGGGYYHGNMMLIDDHTVVISSYHWGLDELSTDRHLGSMIYNKNINEFFRQIFEADWARSPSLFNGSYNGETGLVPNSNSNSVLISEFFYDTYLDSEPDEYFALTNPSSNVVDLSGWFVTDLEGTLWLPNGMSVQPGETIYITKYGVDFQRTFGFEPDFEYVYDSDPNVTDLNVINGLFQLSNSGDEIIVMDPGGNIIDAVIYGTSKFADKNWYGRPVADVSEGRLVKRRIDDPTGKFHDTDSAVDWHELREFYPLQSNFPLRAIPVIESPGSKPIITAFVSPDSSFGAIYSELASASRSIFVNVYQLDHEKLVDLLIEQSENGLDVRILLEGDPVGGLSYKGRSAAYRLQKAGCSVRLMINDPLAGIHDRYAYNHAKYAVVDGSAVIVMSENWKPTGVPADNTAGNRGTGVIIRNRTVAEYFLMVFLEDSDIDHADVMEFDPDDAVYGINIDSYNNAIEDDGGIDDFQEPVGDYLPRFAVQDLPGEALVTPVFSPDHSLLDSGSILELIRTAESEILVEQLQFYKTWGSGIYANKNVYLEALIDAAERGCRIRILLDSAFIGFSENENDNDMVVDHINSIAAEENLEELLQARLIHLTDPAGGNELEKVHNKGIIVDGRAVYVGSMNWGYGGPIKNREAGVIIDHAGASEYFRQVFYFDWNLTLNAMLDVSVPYSTNIVFTNPGDRISSELLIFNNNKETAIELNFEQGNYIGNQLVEMILNRSELNIQPCSFGTVSVTFTLADLEYDTFHSKLELKANGLNMTTTLLVFDIEYREPIEFNTGDNDTSTPAADGWDVKRLDTKMVLMVIIIAMILISVTRDVIYTKMGKG